ncbi:MAG TPA: ferritin family protein [Desulfuromonadaceae bacterium]
MRSLLRVALHTAALFEKQSFDFYLRAADLVENSRAKQMFKLLASEELAHMQEFCRLYHQHGFGDLSGLADLPADLDTTTFRNLLTAVTAGTLEREALEISLREEQACIDNYSELIRALNEPDARRVFEHALRETRVHLDIIRDEYMRLTRLADTPDEVVYVAEPVEVHSSKPKKNDPAPALQDNRASQRLLGAPK